MTDKEIETLKKDIADFRRYDLEDYSREIEGRPLEEIWRDLKKFKTDFLVVRWLRSYIGLEAQKLARILFQLYPEFEKSVRNNPLFSTEGEKSDPAREKIFRDWLWQNSELGKPPGAIAWLAMVDGEIRWYFYDLRNRRNMPVGQDTYIPFGEWRKRFHKPPDHKILDIKVDPERFRESTKGLEAYAQRYADSGGRVGKSGTTPKLKAVRLPPAIEAGSIRDKLKARFKIRIDGEFHNGRPVVCIGENEEEVELTRGDFERFLKLAIKAKNDAEGVPKSQLVWSKKKKMRGPVRSNSDYTSAKSHWGYRGVDQAIDRIRSALKPALQSTNLKDPRRFVENYKVKKVRLSAHHSLISFDKDRLLAYADDAIKKLAADIP